MEWTIDKMTTGIVSNNEKKTRSPSFREREKLSLSSVSNFAEYPALTTAFSNSLVEVPLGTKICALSVAKLTVAFAPGTLFSDFSTVPTQDEQVIPSILRSTCSNSVGFLATLPVIASLALAI
jgi:hypothetical protein